MRDAASSLRNALRELTERSAGRTGTLLLTRQAKTALEVPTMLKKALHAVATGEKRPPRGLLAAVRNIEERAGEYESRGAPERRAIGVLVNQLAREWERINGVFPRRKVLAWNGYLEAGSFTRFVSRVMEALPVDAGGDRSPTVPRGEIQRVIHGRALLTGTTRKKRQRV